MTKLKTKAAAEATLRSVCPMACGLDLLGDKWTLLIVRDIMLFGRNEFGHFLNAGEGISTNILTERLERLQKADIIEKLPHPTNGRKSVFRLTDKGRALAPVLVELVIFGFTYLPNTQIPESVKEAVFSHKEHFIERIKNGETFNVLQS